MATQIRYYAYSPTLGRRLLQLPDGENITDEAEAIRMSQRLAADNVIREEGPVSKPTSFKIIWARLGPLAAADAKATGEAYRLGLVQVILAKHFPDQTVRKIGEAAREILAQLP
jgi:hypothetical protein